MQRGRGLSMQQMEPLLPLGNFCVRHGSAPSLVQPRLPHPMRSRGTSAPEAAAKRTLGLGYCAVAERCRRNVWGRECLLLLIVSATEQHKTLRRLLGDQTKERPSSITQWPTRYSWKPHKQGAKAQPAVCPLWPYPMVL